MPALPSSARYAMLGAQSGTDFVRLPDGSLIMTGNRQVQQPGMLDRLRAAASSIIPAGIFKRTAEPSVPWWIAQPQVAAQGAAPAPAPTNAPSAPGQQAWDAIAKEAAHEEAIKNQLGDFSQKVLNSPQLIEGRWLFPGK